MDDILDVLLEVDEYLDDRVDVNDDGGPNTAMVIQRRVQAIIASLERAKENSK